MTEPRRDFAASPTTPEPAPSEDASPQGASPQAPRPSRRGVLGLLGGGLVVVAGGAVAARQIRATASPGDGAANGTSTDGFLSSAQVHPVSITLDTAAFTSMLEGYKSSGDKAWIEASITLDGATYARAGMRLKGNSSLRSASTSSPPEALPWLVRLDKYVKGQNHEGMTELVIRSNSTATALNEALALDLLAKAGLASQRPALLRLSVNGSDEVLRLAVENPADAWVERVFDGEHGLLYKAEASGDYSYRGENATAYDDVFDQESGEADDLTPLIAFLKFINESSDAEFASGIASHLDVEAFTTYLAFQSVIDNFDDIDGPGNNSYLWWAEKSDQMTIVAWDHNLAFGARAGGGAMGGGGGRTDDRGNGGARPSTAPSGGVPSGGVPSGQAPNGGPPATNGRGNGGGMSGRANVLVTKFSALDGRAAALTTATATLKQTLYSSGYASERLDAWASLASSTGLVEAATVSSEKAQIEAYFTK